MNDNSQTLSCVMIPMSGRQLLLPNVSIAEVVDYASADAGANTVLIQRSFSVPCESAAVLARAHMIRNARGTSDLRLAVDSKEVDRALTYTSQGQWEDAAVFWAGVMNSSWSGPLSSFMLRPRGRSDEE